MPYVPVYSICNVSAVSAEWNGVVNMRGIGAVNQWTYARIHRTGKPLGGRFTQSIEGELRSLNPCVANSSHEWNVLQQLYSPLLTANPETLEDMAILAREWETETWSPSAGKTGMKITFKLLDGVVWHDGEPFTAEDVKFCIEYLRDNKVPMYETIWSNLAKVDAPDRTTVQIYLNATGYRYLHQFASMTFLPKHIWKDVKDYKTFRPWEEPHPTVKGLTRLIGQGPFIFEQCNLKEYVKTVWNPLYFKKNPEKPGLLEKLLAPQTASVGDVLSVRYKILNHTGQPVTDAAATFKLRIKRSDGTMLLDLSATYVSGAYDAKIDTGRIGSGEYLCEFSAIPYGQDTFTLVISQPLWIFLLVGAVAAAIVAVAIIFRTKRHNKHQVVRKNFSDSLRNTSKKD